MKQVILRRHRLHHLPELKVDPELYAARFPASCSMGRCTGQCCASGVWMDAAEQRRIVEHVGLIQQHMDASQEARPERWFEDEWVHPDFPSGRGVGTAVNNGSCVFLAADRRCVLQKASTGLDVSLKPFFCFAFPISIHESELFIDEARDAACCGPDPAGPQTIFDLCAGELEYVLGAEGVAELKSRREF